MPAEPASAPCRPYIAASPELVADWERWRDGNEAVRAASPLRKVDGCRGVGGKVHGGTPLSVRLEDAKGSTLAEAFAEHLVLSVEYATYKGEKCAFGQVFLAYNPLRCVLIHPDMRQIERVLLLEEG